MNAAYQFLFAPSQQSVYNALIGGIRGDIEMINPSGIPYQVDDKSKGCEALFRLNVKCFVLAGQQPEYVDPQPEQITSLCYRCTHYEDCHDKTATVTSCNAYKNRREAQKTDEERYNEEQAAIDRETRKKLREKQQEEKMQQLPSDGQQKQRDIRLTPQKYAEITAGKLTFLLLKKDGFKIGEELELGEFTDGKATGRKIDVEIVYIWADWTGLDDDYCIIGFNVTAFDE